VQTTQKIVENQIVIKDMNCNCFSYVSCEIWSSSLQEGLVKFDVNSEKGGSEVETRLKFDECLQVQVETFEDIVSVRITNLNEMKVQVLNIEFDNSEIDVCSDELPFIIENEQEYHTFTQVRGFPTILTITYINLYQRLKPLFSSQILQGKSQEVQYSQPILRIIPNNP
jgi:hypothetical protein